MVDASALQRRHGEELKTLVTSAGRIKLFMSTAAAQGTGPTSRYALGTGCTSSTVQRTPTAASRASVIAPRADRGKRQTCWPHCVLLRVPPPSLQDCSSSSSAITVSHHNRMRELCTLHVCLSTLHLAHSGPPSCGSGKGSHVLAPGGVANNAPPSRQHGNFSSISHAFTASDSLL